MIEAPLERLLQDNCQAEAEALYADLIAASVASVETDILIAVRTVAVAFDLPPPLGAALTIYCKILGDLPRAVLLQTTEQVIREYRYPGFPRPSEWMDRAKGKQALLERARVMMTVYPQRRKVAERKYGQR